MTKSATEITYFYERWRALSSGMLETAGQTFLLLIAVRIMHAGPTAKALVVSGSSVGLIVSLVAVAFITNWRWPPARAASRLAALGSISLLIAAMFPVLPVFVVCSVVGLASAGTMTPLLTQVYEDNYADADRGRRFSRTVMIRVAIAMAFSYLAGEALNADVGRYRWLLCVYAAAFAFGSFCLSRIPSNPLTPAGGSHPFRALRFVREDRLFRLTLMCWMLMGFANMMMWPMRVEYLANEKYGLTLDSMTIALLVGVIPNAARLLVCPVWGAVFDRMNFLSLRVVLNIGFAVGILAFFTGTSMVGLILGAIAFGVANAGGDVAWSLWVTKFAPTERVAEYMSVHTFFTGLRGLVAPLVAFHLVAHVSIGTLGMICAILILAASLVLARESKARKLPDSTAALVDEDGQP